MRISTTEINALRTIIGALDPAGRIYLYGSRLDDTRRGGDIDVYLQATERLERLNLVMDEARFGVACFSEISDYLKQKGLVP